MADRRSSTKAVAIGLILLALFQAVNFALTLYGLSEGRKTAARAREAADRAKTAAQNAEGASRANRAILDELEKATLREERRELDRLRALEEFRGIARAIDENNRRSHDALCRVVNCRRPRRLVEIAPSPRDASAPRQRPIPTPTPQPPPPPIPRPSPEPSPHCILGLICIR